jgi:UDP-3-O-acyl-N-acetylglucosamine deacetylase
MALSQNVSYDTKDIINKLKQYDQNKINNAINYAQNMILQVTNNLAMNNSQQNFITAIQNPDINDPNSPNYNKEKNNDSISPNQI